jgi:hypothetical protein
LKYLKVVLAEVRDVLALNLSGEALKEKAKDMGYTNALECTCWTSYRCIYIDILLLSAVNKTDEDPRL